MKTVQHRTYAGVMPKFWRPKLSAKQVIDAKIIHWDLITRFVNGTATKTDLWDWIETGYTYTQIMQLHMDDGTEFAPEAIAAISDQIDIYQSVIARYRTTGRVGFSGPELQTARLAAQVMDELLHIDRNGIAVRAGQWAVRQMDKIRALGSSAMN